ncbi:MAG TPA: multiheme c-type cytochrome [Anaerolineae bacterium]|nr:multiheme c-type cytochrome [Anaerolineae bacterium]
MKKVDRRLVYAAFLLTVASAFVFIREFNSPAPKSITPTLTGKPELCLTCHEGIEEISASHPLDAFGCVVCHGGNALALDADLAHTGLRGGKNPSDFGVVEASCGGSECHSGSAVDQRDHIQRALTSVQATYAGAIAQVRRTFGAQPDAVARYGVFAIADDHVASELAVPSLAQFDPAALGDPQPVIDFAARCLNCHLSNQPTNQPYYYRSTGCAACHVAYGGDGLYRGGDPTIDQTAPGHAAAHRLTTAISYTTCNTCHNRGNYSLRQMTFLPRPDLPAAGAPLSEDRLRDYYQPIGQFTRCEWELDCIDCHTSTEAMGDGDLYSSKFDIQYVQCKTCHGTLTEPPATATVTDPNDVELRRARLNGRYTLQVGDTVLLTERGEKLAAVRFENGKFVQTLKVSGQQLEVPLVMGTACEQKPDEQESRYCHECHAYTR